ncbi:MAG: M23 family metallopeptidase [Chloroflexus sp.]|uniref:M23 family metallopeptidase n=1 Tax=Chloroflexus sp. TaxID=1904827 RepID=UPI00404AC4CF
MTNYMWYLSSTLLWFFLNPFGFWQGMMQVFGQVVAVGRSLFAHSTNSKQPIALSLPFEGYWTVANGGVDKKHSHSWSVIAQRYAYDFYITDDQGKSYQGAGKKPEDYYAFGRAVLAPADGTVVEVRDDMRDFPHSGTGWIDWRTRDLRGNYIVIKHDEQAYSLIAHLKQGSCGVTKGDFVQRGQVIGLCGNSGHSTEPHIHFHLQNHPNFYLAIGLPVQFMHVAVQAIGSERVEVLPRGYITKNHNVANLSGDDGSNQPAKETTQIIDASVSLSDFITSLVSCLLTILGVLAILRYLVYAVQLVGESLLRVML